MRLPDALKFITYVFFGGLILSCVDPNSQSNQPGETVLVQQKKMQDGKIWMTENLDIDKHPSFCYDDAIRHCNRFGRLYTWESASNACNALGNGWRLPTDQEWTTMISYYGGVDQDSILENPPTYGQLVSDGASGLNVKLGGNRSIIGRYERIEAHGFYWSSTEADSAEAYFYNFAKNKMLVNRHSADKRMAFSVRCVREDK